MIRLAADHNPDKLILQALTERVPGLDLVRLRDIGLAQAPDPQVLEWAAAEGRLLVTHDRKTMVGHAYEPVRADRAMPGVVEIPRTMPLAQALEEPRAHRRVQP